MSRVTSDEPVLDQRLRRSGMLLLAGLGVQIVTFFWSTPMAFVLFLGVGSLLVAAGVCLFLWTLISKEPTGAQLG